MKSDSVETVPTDLVATALLLYFVYNTDLKLASCNSLNMNLNVHLYIFNRKISSTKALTMNSEY